MAFVLAAIVLAAPARADFDSGMAAYYNQDYDTAFELLLPEAKAGNAKAQCAVALMYHHGRGVAKNPSTAAEWYRRAADGDDLIATNNLGVMCRRGDGVKKDYAEAVRLFETAMLRGYALSAYHLAEMYRLGEGLERNALRAYVLYDYSLQEGVNTRIADRIENHKTTLARELSKEQLAQAKQLVDKLRSLAAERAGTDG